MTIEQAKEILVPLEVEANRLWKELKPIQKVYEAKQEEWVEVFKQVESLKKFIEIGERPA